MVGYSGADASKGLFGRCPGGGLLLIAGLAILEAVPLAWPGAGLPVRIGTVLLLCVLAIREARRYRRSGDITVEELGTGLDGLLARVRGGIVTHVNVPGADRLGMTPDEVVGQPLSRFLARVPATGGWQPNELNRKDGTTVRVETVWVARGDTGPALLLARELAGPQPDEAALREAKELAELASRARSRFLANVSHELRTPLNAIVGFSEILVEDLRGGGMAGPVVEYAENIRESSLHLLAIVNDMLDEVDVAALVTSALRIASVRAEKGRVRLERQIQPGMPRLHADGVKLKQILLNLVSNAIKFTRPGGVVTVEASFDPERGAELVVADTGIGMTAGEIEIAMQPFRQIASALGRGGEGTGLGLPLARSLAELHGGALLIESEPGVGTRATVRLPPERLLLPQPAEAVQNGEQEAPCGGA
jgi:signal transduction histidine kinase